MHHVKKGDSRRVVSAQDNVALDPKPINAPNNQRQQAQQGMKSRLLIPNHATIEARGKLYTICVSIVGGEGVDDLVVYLKGKEIMQEGSEPAHGKVQHGKRHDGTNTEVVQQGKEFGFDLSRGQGNSFAKHSSDGKLGQRGLGSREKKIVVRHLVGKERPDMLLIQETKLEKLEVGVIRAIWGSEQCMIKFVQSLRTSGGLLSVWKADFFNLEYYFESCHFILLVGCIKKLNLRYGFENIYAPNLGNERRELWVELQRNEHLNEMAYIKNFVEETRLMDLPMQGGRFTYRNFREDEAFSRLNRFFNHWLEEKSFSSIFLKAWEKTQVTGSGCKGFIEGCINTTFITLAPKCSSPESIRDCRPISFVGNIYKIITTVLANRMKKVIGEVIGNQQFAFMFGRQLVDCALIANEVVDIMRKDRVGGVFFKVD
ncbi:Uncharacterized protein TCM_003568 [Theobroma cacao]|uniref:Reverse transcriptase domain-containing protein n=1 Tax=Theobroma cacao TaxID=3641 RepID=A0A061DW32_THECC|nr:Uncharacterized protein TCM_003568 [Theobroma cacao]